MKKTPFKRIPTLVDVLKDSAVNHTEVLKNIIGWIRNANRWVKLLVAGEVLLLVGEAILYYHIW